MTLDLRAVEQRLKKRQEYWHDEGWPADEADGDLAVALAALRAHRIALQTAQAMLALIDRGVTPLNSVWKFNVEFIVATLSGVTDAEEVA